MATHSTAHPVPQGHALRALCMQVFKRAPLLGIRYAGSTHPAAFVHYNRVYFAFRWKWQLVSFRYVFFRWFPAWEREVSQGFVPTKSGGWFYFSYPFPRAFRNVGQELAEVS